MNRLASRSLPRAGPPDVGERRLRIERADKRGEGVLWTGPGVFSGAGCAASRRLYPSLFVMRGSWPGRGAPERRRRPAFSLMELVVTIVIIGVMAAIAIPRISRGSEGAGGSAAMADLAVMRKAIDMYAAEHGGAFPGSTTDGLGADAESEDAFVSHLTMFTDFDGQASVTGVHPHVYGPYIVKGIPPAPIGAFTGSTKVKVVTTGPERVAGGNFGWVYNVTNGEIILNTSEEEEQEIIDRFGLVGGDLQGVGGMTQ